MHAAGDVLCPTLARFQGGHIDVCGFPVRLDEEIYATGGNEAEYESGTEGPCVGKHSTIPAPAHGNEKVRSYAGGQDREREMEHLAWAARYTIHVITQEELARHRRLDSC